MDAFRKVVVVGAGVMGHSLAMLHAQKTPDVRLVDREEAILANALKQMRDGLQTLKDAGMLDETVDAVMTRIHTGTSLDEALAGADLVVEAISESPEVKRAFFAQLVQGKDGVTPLGPETLVASNTSSLDIFALAPQELLPRLYAAHHFVPPHIIPLVEVVQPAAARPEVTARFMDHYRSVGAIPVLLKKFCPGFVINRLQSALHKELFQFLADDIIDPQDLDLAVKASFGVRLPILGIVKRLDFAGLGLALGNFTRLQPDAAPPAHMAELVRNGHLGVQTGKGFYDYGDRPLRDVLRQRDEKMLAVRKVLQQLKELE